jgi:phage-related protein
MRGERRDKPLVWEGTSYNDVRSFPKSAKRRAGFELDQVAIGEDPSDWKPMGTVGPGVREIRITTNHHGGRVEHRVIYVAKFEEAVYVLHAFQKTTQKTSRRAIRIARQRYANVLRARHTP